MKKFYSGLAMLAVLPALSSCGDNGVGGLVDGVKDQCGLECKGVVEANGSVSGIASMDAFFNASLNFKAQAAVIEADVTATLREMALVLELDVDANASAKDLADAIKAEVDGGFGGAINADAGLKIDFQPPRCEVNADVSVQAAAQCDVKVDPGKATVECKGGCVIDAEAKASCEGEVKCSGTAPSFACEGSCEGGCELKAGGVCEGTCEGTCELDGSAKCDGECQGDTDAGGNCTGECTVRAGGTCSGTCTGHCELSVGASCSGQCTGSCSYTPGEATCDGELTCEATASAMVKCDGECKGEVIPPSVSGECKASVDAQAKFEAECKPPALNVSYELAANLSADAQLALEAKLQGFIRAYGKLSAKGAKLDLVADAGGALLDAAGKAVGDVAGKLSASSDIQVSIGAACAVLALDDTKTLIADAGASLSSTAEAVGTVSGSVGG